MSNYKRKKKKKSSSLFLNRGGLEIINHDEDKIFDDIFSSGMT